MISTESERAEAVHQAERLLHRNYLRQQKEKEKVKQANFMLGLAAGCLVVGLAGIFAATHWEQIKDKVVGTTLGATYIIPTSYGLYKWVLRDSLLGFNS